MTPEQAAFLRDGVYAKTMEQESETTARVLQAVPAGAAGYKPDPASRTAMELLRHIAAADIRFVDAVSDGQFTFTELIPADIDTPDAVAAWYRTRYAASLARLKEATPEQLAKPIDFRGIFTWPAVRFLGIGLHHTIHHRGQLSSYLRSMGAKVPSIYGESYDAAQARLQAAQSGS
jgi:uncharacterized damage-inducible protein DinB